MAYWLDSKDGEWGFAGVTEEKNLKVADNPQDRKARRIWVDHFIEIVEGKKPRWIVEDRAEFEFLFRCLERIGRPLAFSPMVPRTEMKTERLLNQAA